MIGRNVVALSAASASAVPVDCIFKILFLFRTIPEARPNSSGYFPSGLFSMLTVHHVEHQLLDFLHPILRTYLSIELTPSNREAFLGLPKSPVVLDDNPSSNRPMLDN